MQNSESRGARIEHLLSHNVEEVIERDHLRKTLEAEKPLRIKLGIDPTSPDLHLGHAVVLRKLREFQDLGGKAILIIGDFTAQIGDPSGRDKTRPPLTAANVKENMKNYLRQAGKIIDVKNADVVHNATWLGKLKGEELFELLGQMSIQQIMEREDFQKRLASHTSIRMHELLYPVMQAYDSVATEADVELGGTDQTFNLLVGRSLMEKRGMEPQDILTVPILEGTDGKRKMSKSLGNYIGLDDEPNEMFGKIMSLPDASMQRYFMLCTDIDAAAVAILQKELALRDLKLKLASEIVKIYHGEIAAKKAREYFEKVFSKREIPSDLPGLTLRANELSALDVVLAAGAVKSKSGARRLIEQGGFEFNEKNIKDPQAKLQIKVGDIVRIGKKGLFKVIH